MNRITGPATAGRHRQQRQHQRRPWLAAEPAAPLFPARSDPSWGESRDRLVTLVVQALIVLAPCVLWYLHAGPRLAACGLAATSGLPECSGVVTQYVLSLIGVIISALVTVAAVAVLLVKASQ